MLTSAKELGWELSINPACFHPRTSLREFLQVSSAAGFGCVEISIQQAMALADDLGGLAVLARVVSDLGLQIGQFSGLLPAGPVLPAPLLVGQRAWHAAQSSLAARLEAGAALGCHKAAVTCNPRTNLNLKEARRIAALRLTTLATEASRYGVTLVVELVSASAYMDPTLDGRREFISSLARLVGLMDEVGSSNIELLLDTCHLIASGASLESIRALGAGRVGYVHFSGWPTGVAGEDMVDSLRCLPDEGNRDAVDTVLCMIRATGYEGPVSLELFWSNTLGMSADATARRLFGAASAAFGRGART